MILGEDENRDLVRVEKIIEKPKPAQASSTLATIGRYVFTPTIFKHLRGTKPDRNGEIQLTSAISSLLHEEDVYAYRFAGRRYDVGDKLGWLRANVDNALARPDLKKGVQRMVSEIYRSFGNP